MLRIETVFDLWPSGAPETGTEDLAERGSVSGSIGQSFAQNVGDIDFAFVRDAWHIGHCSFQFGRRQFAVDEFIVDGFHGLGRID